MKAYYESFVYTTFILAGVFAAYKIMNNNTKVYNNLYYQKCKLLTKLE